MKDSDFRPIPDIAFILPCKNEAEGLARIVRDLISELANYRYTFEVIIVDNNSIDESKPIALELAEQFACIRVVECPIDGYGSAVRYGIAATACPHVVWFDADTTYTSKDVCVCAQLIHDNPHALCIGNRLSSTQHIAMPWTHRVIGTPFFSVIIWMFFGTKITDPNCGLRGMSREKFTQLACTASGMEFASEHIIRALHAKIPCIQFPISYAPRIGASKLRTVRDGIRHLSTIIALRLRFFYTRG